MNLKELTGYEGGGALLINPDHVIAIAEAMTPGQMVQHKNGKMVPIPGTAKKIANACAVALAYGHNFMVKGSIDDVSMALGVPRLSLAGSPDDDHRE